jgi:broad specificity phosphatase PhoE
MNVLIVCHGLTLRLFLMRWFQYSVKDFEGTENPGNAQVCVMERIFSEQKVCFVSKGFLCTSNNRCGRVAT